jgi:hypothetical protein
VQRAGQARELHRLVEEQDAGVKECVHVRE